MLHLFSSLRFRFLLLVLIALVPAAGLVIYSGSEQHRAVAIQAKENALRLAKITANNYEQTVGSTRQFLSLLAQVPAVHDLDKSACRIFLADLLSEYPYYPQLGVAYLDGSASCTAIPDIIQIDPRNQLHFRRSLETKDFSVGEYRIGYVSGKSVIPFGYPLLDKVGQIQGIVFASLDLGLFNTLAAQALLPPGSDVTVIDRNATVLARYPEPEKWVGRSIPDTPIAKAVLGQEDEATTESVGVDNIQRLYAFTSLRSVPDGNIVVIVGLPASAAFAEVNQILTFNLVAIGLVAVLALVIAWIGGDVFFLRHVRALSSVTGRLADGDLSARTGLNYGVGELSQLAHSFDKMVEALEQRQEESRQTEEQSRRWGTQLEGLINGVAESIGKPSDMGSMATVALYRTLGAMGLTTGCAFLYRRNDLVMVAHEGISEADVQRMQRLKAGEKATGEFIKLLGSDAAQNISGEILSNTLMLFGGIRTWTSVPIKTKDRTLGIMCLACPETRSIEPHELNVLTAVGQQIGVAIENAELYEQVQSISALKERERISRELHDGLAQILGYLCIRNKATSDLLAAGEMQRAGALLHEMQGTMQEAYQDVRESILGLRTVVSPRRDLASALREYVHKFTQQTGIRVNLVWDGSVQRECTPEAEVQLLRIIQESLSNVRKHSEAKQAWIRFDHDTSSTSVTIEDNGRGFDAVLVSQDGQLHYGLQTMRERAESVGGSFQMWSQVEQGTKVVVTLPCKQGEE